MPTCKILFFLLLALFVLCGECDEFKYGQVGGEVSMDCGVPQNSDVEWKLNDILIIKINGRRGTRQKGSSFIKDKVSVNGGSLKVPRLETRDSGVYSCNSGKRYALHVASVFAKPGPVLVQSSSVELHCDIGENPNTEVEWQRPSNDKIKDKKVIHLKSVTSNDDGQWTCLFKDLKLTLTLAVVAGLQTTAVKVPEGENITLPCSLPRSVSQRVVDGKWTADHLPTVSFPTLKNTGTKGLHWSGDDSSRVIFTSGQLNINYDVMLTNAQPIDEGKYVCTVEFEGGVKLTAETNLTVVAKHSVNTGGKKGSEKKGKTPAGGVTWKKEVFGIQLWIWIAVGASSVVLIVLIIVTVLVRQRNKRMKKRVKKLRSMRQPLTAKDYCRCRAESEVELVQQERPLPVPRQQRNPRTRTAGPNHTIEKRREQDY